MRLALLSDARYPTRLDQAGHGLGRSVARLGTALAKRGHNVTVYAAPDSEVACCTTIVGKGEGDDLAQAILDLPYRYDVVIDSTHAHRLMERAPDYPAVAKVCDMEHRAPFNRVYGTRHHAMQHSDPEGLVIPEGLDVDSIPFEPGSRHRFLVWAALKVAWKNAPWAQMVAAKRREPILMVGEGKVDPTPETRGMRALSPAALYELLKGAEALVSAVPSMGMLEAAACGTPSLALVRDEFIEPGITGFLVGSNGEGANIDVSRLNRRHMRDWVAAERSIDATVLLWEQALERAAKGERW